MVKEGKLYNPETGKYARSVSFKDQVELVQRMFQLTSNTGRFCDGNGNTRVTLPDGSPNPVEACGNSGGVSNNVVGADGVITSGGNRPSTCFNGNNIKLTCFDTDTWVLYLRSRVLDRTGHAWLSNTTGALP